MKIFFKQKLVTKSLIMLLGMWLISCNLSEEEEEEIATAVAGFADTAAVERQIDDKADDFIPMGEGREPDSDIMAEHFAL